IICCILLISLIVLLYCFFFFSSRRRHTRSKRDWSSDVCSSDLDIFETLPNVEVTKSLRSEPLSDTVQLTMCAYGDETEEIKEFIKKSYQEGKVNVLVGHLGVEGSLTGKGSHRLEGAFGYQDLLPDNYAFILLGHYHRRQYFKNPNHFYGGSLMQQSFSDEQEANGVHLIDTEK